MNLYYASNRHQHGSQLSMARYTTLKPSLSDTDIARAECIHGLAVITNIVPVAFRTVFHVFSNPNVLSRVRKEVEAPAAMEESTTEGTHTRIVDMNRLKDVHFLTAIIQETLRYRARGTGPRMVLEDVTLTGDECEYHIEKDSVVILAHEGIHHSKGVWGDDAEEFVADRFLPGNKTVHNAFRGFGGGANMCPGKAFATAEIAALIAVLAI
ncbi:cytochrome P450 [Lophiotrema nucula]|uniref:Cytochrome P450 n=1 Tax=Lophiotrema nucula TaxID=690887 RepID=A0A6A5YZJ3_9PLEO|nr:cytochrome P450 [Lophiotrema nucula]